MTTIIEFILGYAREFVGLFNQMSPYLLFGFVIAGILHSYFPIQWLSRHLSKHNLLSIVKAVILGIPLPLCSCSVIPSAMMLKKQGASKSAVLSYLVATPITGVDSILATYALFGGLFSVFRVIVSSITAILVGIISSLFIEKKEMPSPVEEKNIEKISSCCSHAQKKSVSKFRQACEYGFVTLLHDIWKWLFVGLLVGSLISYLVPDTLMTAFSDHTLLSMIIILLISIPMYICSTGSIPIAASLMMKGLSPGVALVFLLAGPATNTVTISVISKELGRKAVIVYVTCISVFSIAFGYLLNFIWQPTQFSFDMHEHLSLLPSLFETACSVLFILLVVNSYVFTYGLFRRKNNV